MLVGLETIEPLGGKLTTKRLSAVMNLFQRGLIELGEVETTWGTTVTKYRWTNRAAASLTDYIFERMLGCMASRIFNDDNRESVGVQRTPIRDEWIKDYISDPNIPPLVIKLIRRISSVGYLDQTTCGESICRYWSEYKLCKTYQQLKVKEEENDEKIIAYLQEQIKRSPQDTPATSIVDRFLDDGEPFAQVVNKALGKENRARHLKKMCQRGVDLICLVDVFGPGALGFVDDETHKE